MKINRVTTLVLVVFILTLGAGVVTGLLAGRLPGTTIPATVAGPGAPLSDELGLSPEQRVKMAAIWVEVRDLSNKSYSDALSADDTRKKAIHDLLTTHPMNQDQERAVMQLISGAKPADAKLAEYRELEGKFIAAKVDKYNQIERGYSDKCAELKALRDVSFKHAIDRTSEILSPVQREKYNKILQRRLGADQSTGKDPNSGATMTPAGT